MRQIEKQMNFAVTHKSNWAGSNTSVSYHPSENLSEVRLHGHLIAWYDHSKKRLIAFGIEQYQTKLIQQLNALLYEINTGVRVFQKNYDWFVSDYTGKRIVDFYDGLLVNKDGFSSLETHPNVA